MPEMPENKITCTRPEQLLFVAMKICAEAHNAELADWRDEGQVAINSESVPVMSDVWNICDAIFKNGHEDAVEVGWGYTNVYLDAPGGFLDEINMELLLMALPYGTQLDYQPEDKGKKLEPDKKPETDKHPSLTDKDLDYLRALSSNEYYNEPCIRLPAELNLVDTRRDPNAQDAFTTSLQAVKENSKGEPQGVIVRTNYEKDASGNDEPVSYSIELWPWDKVLKTTEKNGITMPDFNLGKNQVLNYDDLVKEISPALPMTKPAEKETYKQAMTMDMLMDTYGKAMETLQRKAGWKGKEPYYMKGFSGDYVRLNNGQERSIDLIYQNKNYATILENADGELIVDVKNRYGNTQTVLTGKVAENAIESYLTTGIPDTILNIEDFKKWSNCGNYVIYGFKDPETDFYQFGTRNSIFGPEVENEILKVMADKKIGFMDAGHIASIINSYNKTDGETREEDLDGGVAVRLFWDGNMLTDRFTVNTPDMLPESVRRSDADLMQSIRMQTYEVRREFQRMIGCGKVPYQFAYAAYPPIGIDPYCQSIYKDGKQKCFLSARNGDIYVTTPDGKENRLNVPLKVFLYDQICSPENIQTAKRDFSEVLLEKLKMAAARNQVPTHTIKR